MLAALAFAVTASSGVAAGRARGRLLGAVPHAGAPRGLAKSAAFSSSSFLTFDANYASLINQYFTDVAHDSVGTSNVYSIATQYQDGAGFIQYQSTFGGSYVDNAPLPANGCADGQDSVCLTDQQLQDEIQRVLTLKGWHGSTSHMFFLMTPDGVGSCFDSSGNQCTTNVYCAYHSDFINSSGEPVIYANQPYDATINGCGSGSSPNNDDADTELNTISHEHNESITDPFGDAWYAADGNENGDLCAWGFGSPITLGGDYNQVINGDHYWLQQEYSNMDKGCVQSLGGHQSPPTTGHGPLANHGGQVMHTNTTYAIYWLPTPGNTALPVVTGTAAVNHTLTTSTGSWNGAPTGYSYQWQRCSSTGTGCVNIPGATASTYAATSADGGSYVRSTVSAGNVNGSSAYVASAGQVVVPLPVATGPPVVSGVAAVGKKLSTTTGAWNTPATFVYQWLRCAADGSGCRNISGATSAIHVAVAADSGRRLEARISATNVVGTTQALSKLSGVVVAVPHVTKAPRISGRAQATRRLSASRGSWSGPPKGYRYQWLRCNGHGGSCVRIRHATHAKYRLTRLDALHRLRVQITAVDAAGSTMANSRATARVPAAR